MEVRKPYGVVELDDIVKAMSPFNSFKALINAQGNYRPTIRYRGFNSALLAKAYDKAQEKRGDTRRAYTDFEWLMIAAPF